MTDNNANILIVDDDVDVLTAARMLLKNRYSSIETENNPHNIPDLLDKKRYDLILLDMNFKEDVSSGTEGFYWLGKILESDPSAVVILITAYGDVEMAVRGIREGATEFILKPWQNEKLLATISAGISLKRSKTIAEGLRLQQNQLSEEIDQQFRVLIGNSPQMKKLISIIDKVSRTDASVLIFGENGSGKEHVARTIHRKSGRKNKIFFKVDMTGNDPSQLDSSLFGYTEGSFPGANEDKVGQMEIASGGTLFLDEIGNLSLAMQSKLHNVLETGQISKIGDTRSVPVDLRYICATNTPLYDLISDDKFRQDLLYKINTIEIYLPPLRERSDDIPLLIEHFFEFFSAKYKKPVSGISHETLTELQRYPWPGNVRELKHSIERAVLLSDGNLLKPSDFFLSKDLIREKTDEPTTYLLRDLERTAIQKSIARNSGNISKSAKELGLTRTSFYRRIKKYGL